MRFTERGKQRQIALQLDEMGSFVGNKHPKRWLWCAYDIRLKRVIAHVFGCRGVSTLRRLLDKRHEMGCSVTLYCTDAWRAYKKVLPQAIHIASKTYTQAIERVFLSLRTALKRLNRRTIGFSRSIEIHDKVIGWIKALSSSHHHRKAKSNRCEPMLLIQLNLAAKSARKHRICAILENDGEPSLRYRDRFDSTHSMGNLYATQIRGHPSHDE